MNKKINLFGKERNSAKKGKEEEEDEAGYSKAGPSQEQEDEEAELVNAVVTTQSPSLGELQDT